MTGAWSAGEAAGALAGGQPARTEGLARARLAAAPDDPDAWFLLGAALHRRGDRDGALEAFDACIRVAPHDLRPRTALGALLAQAGRHAEALATFEAALALQPADPRLLVNAALALEHLGRDTDALAHYDRALAAYPGMGEALLNRTALRLRLGQPEAALADADRLVRLFPGLAEAWHNRAQAALALGRPAPALADCERALEVKPDYARAWTGKGVALAVLGRLEEAEHAFDRARALDPEAGARLRHADGGRLRQDGDPLDARRIWLLSLWHRHQACDWEGRERDLARAEALVAAVAGGPRALRDRALAFPAIAWPVAAATRRALLADIAAEVRHNAAAECRGLPPAAAPGAKLRIGYLAADVREHPSLYNTLPIYAAHDRDRIDVHVYSIGRTDADAVARVSACCGRFADLAGHPDADVARRIRADGIDVLVDLAGYTEDARPEILAMRPAPVRVSLFGMPGSLGPGIVDYRVTDAVVTPPAHADEFSEALLRLPGTFWVCDPAPATAARPSRAAVGLPADGVVLCSFNTAYKFEPDCLALWCELLQALPGAVLWLLEGPPGMRERLQREAQVRGVARERLVFAPRVERGRHLARLPLADVFLDTFTYNAHTTASDALVAGVPVVTCAGTTMASRLGASLVHAAGLSSLVATDARSYVRIARELAGDAGRLQAVRAQLARRDAPLFDQQARVRALERGYAAAIARHRAGLPPADLDIDDA